MTLESDSQADLIRLVAGTLHRDAALDSMRVLKITTARDRNVMVQTDPAVLVQRTAATEQDRHLVAAELTQTLPTRLNGVVIENHVNVVWPRADEQLLTQAAPALLLTTKTMDWLVRCNSGSVALSAYELDSIPLPDRITLSKWEDLSDDALEKAVGVAYRPTLVK